MLLSAWEYDRKEQDSNSVHSAGIRCKMRMKEVEGCVVHGNMIEKSRILTVYIVQE
jgi:hypothetical protein